MPPCPMRCYSCNTYLADKWIRYVKRIEEIDTNPIFNEAKKIEETMKMLETELKLVKYCCKGNMTGNVDLTPLIL
jgi:DNA-directed RNA polymerase subunit N (RpoN/RPB10)